MKGGDLTAVNIFIRQNTEYLEEAIIKKFIKFNKVKNKIYL